MARANAFWPTAVVGEADSVNSVSASACHIGGPKGVSPGQKALLHGSKFEGVSGKLNLLTKTRFAKAGQFAKTCFLEEQLLQVSNPRYHFVKATLENGKQCLTRGRSE